jgi:hypothetical protein
MSKIFWGQAPRTHILRGRRKGRERKGKKGRRGREGREHITKIKFYDYNTEADELN